MASSSSSSSSVPGGVPSPGVAGGAGGGLGIAGQPLPGAGQAGQAGGVKVGANLPFDCAILFQGPYTADHVWMLDAIVEMFETQNVDNVLGR